MDAGLRQPRERGADFRVEAGTARGDFHSVKLTIIQDDDGVTPPCAPPIPSRTRPHALEASSTNEPFQSVDPH
ncbi:hypothetical protein GCM10018952_07790 [Streptosporangium vulgare]